MELKYLGKKYTMKQVTDYIEFYKYKLLSDKYLGIKKYLTIQCPKGHLFEMTFDAFKNQGQRCPSCSPSTKLTYAEVQKRIEDRGFQLLSNIYKNSYRQKLKIKCKHNHVIQITLNSFQASNKPCYKCSGKSRYDYNYVEQFIQNTGYKLLSTTYKSCDTKLTIQCPQGHLFEKTWYKFYNKQQRCPLCLKYTDEQECRDILEKLTKKKFPTIRPDFLKNPQTKHNLELDGYCKELKLAFEYDGEQHYRPMRYRGSNKKFEKIQQLDSLKDELCKKHGIVLIRIPYFVTNKHLYIVDKIKQWRTDECKKSKDPS